MTQRRPGETQLEEDRRIVGKRIRDLKAELCIVQARREREVRSRREEHTVSLVGYTNAGKSTLMNALTGAGVYVEDKLFSTLDTRTRQWRLTATQGARDQESGVRSQESGVRGQRSEVRSQSTPPRSNWGKVLLSDTVGFIRELPQHMVASFKATLEETRQARLLLHVVDASSPAAEEQIQAVNGVLKELGCGDKPTLLVLNKVDRVTDRSYLDVLQKNHRRSVVVSAATGQGLDGLREAVIEMLRAEFANVEIEVPVGNGRVLAY